MAFGLPSPLRGSVQYSPSVIPLFKAELIMRADSAIMLYFCTSYFPRHYVAQSSTQRRFVHGIRNDLVMCHATSGFSRSLLIPYSYHFSPYGM